MEVNNNTPSLAVSAKKATQATPGKENKLNIKAKKQFLDSSYRQLGLKSAKNFEAKVRSAESKAQKILDSRNLKSIDLAVASGDFMLINALLQCSIKGGQTECFSNRTLTLALSILANQKDNTPPHVLFTANKYMEFVKGQVSDGEIKEERIKQSLTEFLPESLHETEGYKDLTMLTHINAIRKYLGRVKGNEAAPALVSIINSLIALELTDQQLNNLSDSDQEVVLGKISERFKVLLGDTKIGRMMDDKDLQADAGKLKGLMKPVVASFLKNKASDLVDERNLDGIVAAFAVKNYALAGEILNQMHSFDTADQGVDQRCFVLAAAIQMDAGAPAELKEWADSYVSGLNDYIRNLSADVNADKRSEESLELLQEELNDCLNVLGEAPIDASKLQAMRSKYQNI